MVNLFQGKTALVVITGASRGIGREIAIQFADIFNGADSTFLLLARNEVALAEVRDEILKSHPNISIELIVADLSQHYSGSIDERIAMLEEKIKFNIRLIIHNAGTVGDLGKRSSELTDDLQWISYLQTNFISTVHLNNLIFAGLNKEEPIYIVNVTSLLSIKPYPSFTQYSVGKAAREAFFRSFATEHPNCRVLSYSPGPVDTQMHTVWAVKGPSPLMTMEVCEKSYDEGVKQIFGRRFEDNNLHRKMLTTSETVKKLIKVLEQDKFENGSRVDFFDK